METAVSAEGKTLAERLRAARIALHMTQRELAGGHFSKAYVSAIERGKMTPSVHALDYLATRLTVPVSYFLGETALDLSSVQRHTPPPPPPEQEQDKKDAAAHLLLCEAEQADIDTAFALLRSAAYLSSQVRPLASYKRASLHLAQDELDEAQALVEEGRAAARATDNAPAEGRLWLVLAQIREKQGETAGAEQAYTDAVTCLEGDPFQDEARAHYSQFLAAGGRYEAAYQIIQATARNRAPQ